MRCWFCTFRYSYIHTRHQMVLYSEGQWPCWIHGLVSRTPRSHAGIYTMVKVDGLARNYLKALCKIQKYGKLMHESCAICFPLGVGFLRFGLRM